LSILWQASQPLSAHCFDRWPSGTAAIFSAAAGERRCLQVFIMTAEFHVKCNGLEA
jgi:hypothetical protein